MNKNNNKNGSRVLQGLLLATTAITGSSVIAATAAMAAGPSGGTVVIGSATITNPSTTQTTITQTSKKALINWNSFSISQGSTVTFNQPNAKSLTVNRVTGPNASAIDGQLLANGSVWLINANGILFGKGSEINVGALIATTSDITDSDFKSGNYSFSKPSSNPNASVTNLGTITTSSGGSVILSAPSVSNQGLIQANLGTVVLGGASTFTVDMTGDNLLRYQISAPVAQAPTDANGNPQSALVTNAGTIIANGGQVVMTARAAQSVQDDVINNTGMVQATSISAHNGEIDLDAGPTGTVNESGTLDVSGMAHGQTGGTVAITGQNVNVADGAKINASGDTGGGTVEIGGGLHGQGTIANAQNVTVGNATITADAITKGNGGTVSVWSSGNTSFNGTISARGGAQGGNGGQVETSGNNLGVGLNAKVDTTAPLGLTGDWLLDPSQIIITATSNSCGCTITPGTITSNLNNGNVTLEADNDIQVLNAVTYTSTNTLSLISGGTIEVQANIQNSSSGDINLVAGWNSSTISSNQNGTATSAPGTDGIPALFESNAGSYGNSSGNITFGTTSGSAVSASVGSLSGSVTVLGHNIALDSGSITPSIQTTDQIGYQGAGGGAINLFATGNLTLDASAGGTVLIGNGTSTTTGSVSGNVSVTEAGVLTMLKRTGSTAAIGDISAPTGTAAGSTTIVFGSLNSSNTVDLLKLASTDLSHGNVTLGETDGNAFILRSAVDYTSANTLTLMSKGDIDVESSFQNDGTGNINLVAGWDGTTPNPAGNSAAYGINNSGTIDIGGPSATGNVFVGSKSGTTSAYGYNLTVDAETGYAQLGYHNAASGNVNVSAKNAVSVYGGGTYGYAAQIGNGGNDITGVVGGNVYVQAGGNVSLESATDDSSAVIGNAGGTVSGNINVSSGGTVSIVADSTISTALIGNISTVTSGQVTGSVTIAADSMSGLGSSIENDLPNGDMLLEQFGNGSITLSGDIEYASGNDLTVVAEGDILVTGKLVNTQATGGGALTLAAGWDGQTISLADLTDVNGSAYGNDIGNSTFHGSVLVGGFGASANANVANVSGSLTVEGNNVTVEADFGTAQIGYNGSGGGEIDVNAKGGITVDAGGTASGNIAQIGNGGSGVSSGNVGGNINLTAGSGGIFVDSEGTNGVATIGNFTGGSTSSQSGNITIVDTGNLNLTASGNNALANIGNWSSVPTTGGATGDISITGGLGGTNNDTVLAAGDVSLNATGAGANAIIGDGSSSTFHSGGTTGGDITINAASLELTAQNNSGAQARISNRGTGVVNGDYDITTTGDITITAYDGDLAAIGHGDTGTASADVTNGTITLDAGGAITIQTYDAGSARIGNANASDSDIQVTAAGDVTLETDSGDNDGTGGNVSIGNFTNGDGNSDPIVAVGGNISVTSNTGDVLLNANDENSTIKIGNSGASTSTSGAVTVSALNTTCNSDCGNIDLFSYGDGSVVQIGNSSSSGMVTGDITVEAGTEVDLDAEGDGAIAQIGNGGLYMGGDVSGNISVTSGGDLVLKGGGDDAAAYAQIGNGDPIQSDDGTGNVSGDIAVNVTGVARLESDGGVAWIGNTAPEDYVESGNVTLVDSYTDASGEGGLGDMIVADLGSTNVAGSGGNVTIAATNPSGDENGVVQISGDIAANTPNDLTIISATSIVVTGSLVNAGTGALTLISGWDTTKVTAADLITDTPQGGAAIVAAFGNTPGSYGNTNYNDPNLGSVIVGGTGASGDAQVGDAGGALTIDGYDVDVEAYYGNAQIGYSGANSASGSITVNAVHDVNVTADQSGLYNDDDPEYETYYSYDAQIGNRGGSSNPIGGSISVNAGNDINVTGNQYEGSDFSNESGYAQIGNGAADGSFEGDVSGDIKVTAGGNITATDGINGAAWIGNNADVGNNYTESGNVTLIAGGNITVSADNLASDLGTGDNGGDVFIGYTNASGSSNAAIFDGVTYDSGNSLTLAATGDLVVDGDIQNSGNGAITLVGGWDGSEMTVSGIVSAQQGYGNNNATITIGNEGDPAVGSAGGTTTVLSDNLTLDATDGNAQIGYKAGAGGDIDITLTGSLSLIGDASDDDHHYTAQIGNGDFGKNPGGDVTITAASISNTANSDVTGGNVSFDITEPSNAIGTSGQYLDVAANNLAITTDGGNAYINSPAQGFEIGVGDAGIELNGGNLYLTANGGITQDYVGASPSATINANAINITTTSGAITLDNSANNFGFATINSAADANLHDDKSLEIDGASVGSNGTLTLVANGNLTQGSGTIDATTLIATAMNPSGAITFNNSGNAISHAMLSAAYDVSLYDSSALEIDGVVINPDRTLTLYDTSAGGITQGSASGDKIVAGSVVATATGATTLFTGYPIHYVTTGGNITLDNAGNSVSNATFTANSNVTFDDMAALTIQKATLSGGTLTLTDTNAGGIGQASGASYGITAGAINATATSGAIVLGNDVNSIGHATLSAATDATFHDASAVEIDGAKVGNGNTLTLYDTGSLGITQGAGASNAIIASNLIATTTAGSNGNIILDNASNSVGTATFTATGNVTLDDSVALTLKSASLSGYALTLNDSGGNITQGSGAITASSVNATTTASSAAIMLTNMGNSFGALTLSAAANASVYDTAALTIDGASVGSGKTLTITDTNAGGIGQGSGSSNAITASNLVVTDASGAITLNNLSNAIGTASITAGGSATLDDSVALQILGATTVGSSASLTLYDTGGAITQGLATTNAISAAILNVTDTSGKVTLTNAHNAVGTLILSATDDSAFSDTIALVLDGITDTGHAFTVVDTGGAITESSGTSQAIAVGSLTATAASFAITLDNASNAVGAATFTAGGDVVFDDSTSFELDGASLAGHKLTLSDTGGAISQGSAPSNAIKASTLLATTTGSSGAITLTNASNAVGTATFAATGNVSFSDTSALTLNGASLSGYTLTLTDTAAGGITEGLGSSNSIIAGALVATDNSGALSFANMSNAVGAVTFSAGGNVVFDDSTGFEVDGASLAGYTLTLDPAVVAPITQGSTSSDAIIASAIIATNQSGGIKLDNTYNSVGEATFSAAGDVTFYDTAALTLNGASLSGHTLTLTDTASGGIGQGSGAINAIVASALNTTSANGKTTLTNTSNAVGNATFSAGGNVNFYDTSALEIDSASLSGQSLTVTVANGNITQGSAAGITANAINMTAASGAVLLTNYSNAISHATISATTDATLDDSTAIEIDGVSTGNSNTFTLADTSGNVTQGPNSTNAITAPAVNVTASSGAISLNNSNNAISSAALTSSGNSTLYDSQDLTVTGVNDGGDLTLLTTGNLTFTGSAQLSTGNLIAVAGWDGTTTTPSSLTTGNAYGNNNGSITIGGNGATGNVAVGSNSGTANTTLAADNITLDAENGYAQLGYHGTGGSNIYAYAKGDITVQATEGSDYALLGNGTGGSDFSGNETGNIYLLAGGDIQLNSDGEGASPWIGNHIGSSGSESGNLTIVAQDENDNCGATNCDLGSMVEAALGSTSVAGSGGNVAVAFTNPQNNGSPVMTITDGFHYNSPHDLTIISGNSLYIDNAIQNAGSGNITLIAGWNSGVVTGQNIIGAVQNSTAVSSLFSSKSSYGQTNNGDTNKGSIEIGCDAGDTTCSSNTAAVGSASGTTTVLTNNLELTAGAGLGAQLGYNFSGVSPASSASGAINVNAQGNIALTGGSVTGSYAQIGDGGYKATGNTSDNITVNAGGIIQLGGGTAQEAYAQIGNGGAESNSNITGNYSDTGLITVTGQSVVLQAGAVPTTTTTLAGTLSAAYAQIGNGGYKSGQNLNGTATIGGNINVTVSPPSNTAGVALLGNGADAYAQIGNGGDDVNYQWVSATGSTITGDINVSVTGVSQAQRSTDLIQMVGGTGSNAYVQIGNGGHGENTPLNSAATPFPVNVSGTITVVDLKLWGGNGTNNFGQIGNGDNDGTGYGNVSGGINIGGTDFNLKNGNGSGDSAGIGNNTGFGTITNNILGYPPPSTGPGAGTQGAISSTTQIPTIPTVFDITTVTITPGSGSSPSNDNGSSGSTPLEQIADGNSEGSQDSDGAADSLGNSLNGHKTSTFTRIIIPGVLTQIVTLGSRSPNGVPPADVDYSSWGNEALWRW